MFWLKCRHKHVYHNTIQIIYLHCEHSVKVIRVKCKNRFVDLELLAFNFNHGVAVLLISKNVSMFFLQINELMNAVVQKHRNKFYVKLKYPHLLWNDYAVPSLIFIRKKFPFEFCVVSTSRKILQSTRSHPTLCL